MTLPGVIGDRPGQSNRPGGRPGGGNRPGSGNRPNDRWPRPGDINIGNNIINSRPGWVTINNNRVTQINVSWQNRLGGIYGWADRYPARVARWQRWGNDVRFHCGHFHNPGLWFTPTWWHSHHHGFCGWHYYYAYHIHGWRYWWTVPTFVAVTNWFSWSAPRQVWSQPVYYDYGQGGNVVYQDNRVYIDGKEIATADEFAESAAALATVPPPATEDEVISLEWLPLGTFAVAMDEKDIDPAHVVQLAVSRQGIISGTLYNVRTDKAQTVQGQVDKDTQRVAMRLGESETLVAETGLYNLTRDEAPLLVHFGTERAETWLLVRMNEPAADEEPGEAALNATPVPGLP